MAKATHDVGMRWLSLIAVAVAVGCSSGADSSGAPDAVATADAAPDASPTEAGGDAVTADSATADTEAGAVCVLPATKIAGACRVLSGAVSRCVDYSTAMDTAASAKGRCESAGNTWFDKPCIDATTDFGWTVRGGCEFNACGGDAGTAWTSREWCISRTPVECNADCDARGGRFLGSAM